MYGSGIPMPSTASKRRAEQPPPAHAQPPSNRMRMSIAGGAGPSRPPVAYQQQQGGLLAPPGTGGYVPRQSTYGAGGLGGSAGQNPLLMSARKDVSQYGKTPLKASTLSVRKTGFLAGNWSIPRETRPIKDRAYQAMMQREIFDYLTQQRCGIPNLALKTLQTPTNREFHLIFQFLILDVDPSYVFGREKKQEDEIILLLRDLRYPLVDTISKTSLAAPGSSSAWPTLLAMLHWLVTIAKELPKWLDPDICNDYNLLPIEELPFDVEIPNFPELITCEYVFNAYAQYMYGHDEFREQDMELENMVERKNEAVVQRCDEAETRIRELRTEIEKLKLQPTELVSLEREHQKCLTDLDKLSGLIEEREVKFRKNRDVVEMLNSRLAAQELEIDELNQEHESILARISSQGVTDEEAARMNADRERLKRAHDELSAKASHSLRAAGEVEIASEKRANEVDALASKYTNLIYNTGFAPRPPEPFQDVNFQLEFNPATDNLSEMVKGANMREVIHPAMRKTLEMTSSARVELENEKLEEDNTLDRLTQECEGMMEDAEPKENQLRVLQKRYEDLKRTVGAETAAANAEAGKLERDIGEIQASVAQSKIALQSRKERLEVEY
ncbi:kinetochore-associated Ndc80 complex subunit ndc80, partial [Tulasnella sp. 427]